jgi:hypothetical protein
LPAVQWWVRNLERRVDSSFWLQTSTDKFYPDFVALLADGWTLVVVYKGEDRWSNDDSKEKRTVGRPQPGQLLVCDAEGAGLEGHTKKDPRVMGKYDVGLVCLNGHEVNSEFRSSPEFNAKFCKQCGEQTIHACPKCGVPIRGFYKVQGVIDLGHSWSIPQYCHECGAAYPWRERKEKALATAIEELDELTAAERDKLKESIPDAIAETPKTEIAIARFKKAIIKAGVIGGKLLTDTLSKVAAEIVVKSMGIK